MVNGCSFTNKKWSLEYHGGVCLLEDDHDPSSYLGEAEGLEKRHDVKHGARARWVLDIIFWILCWVTRESAKR
jgi:hypothetical protein